VKATRYRLRFVTGVALTGATYGSGTYGEGTYGMQASDPLASLRYYLVPWPGGYLTDPSWIYRQGDVLPRFSALVCSDEGPLDDAGLTTAVLVLSDTEAISRSFPLSVESADGDDRLVRDWQPGDLDTPGVYRAAAVITYSSGRRLTIPIDDRMQFVVNPSNV